LALSLVRAFPVPPQSEKVGVVQLQLRLLVVRVKSDINRDLRTGAR